ncbi:MAG: hypothetical protein JO235_11155 [Chroococcidiopsidaceae cyanobacterium CP_BM_RX_35]|nr:hypothetical protein [Chroococcidiopsidaceae cyanobacterium CP_BM_RX_35]
MSDSMALRQGADTLTNGCTYEVVKQGYVLPNLNDGSIWIQKLLIAEIVLWVIN